MAVMRNAPKILVMNTEWRKPFGRLRCRWEDSMKTNMAQEKNDGLL
jgi:hypothetical protein